MIGTIVYDAKLKRPGCAILQAAMGGTIPNDRLMEMSDVWLLAPTPDMGLYPYDSEAMLDAIIALTMEAQRPKRRSKRKTKRRS